MPATVVFASVWQANRSFISLPVRTFFSVLSGSSRRDPYISLRLRSFVCDRPPQLFARTVTALPPKVTPAQRTMLRDEIATMQTKMATYLSLIPPLFNGLTRRDDTDMSGVISSRKVDDNLVFTLGDAEYVAFSGIEDLHLNLDQSTCNFATIVPVTPNVAFDQENLATWFDHAKSDDVSQSIFRQKLLFWGNAPGPILLTDSVQQTLQQQNITFLQVEVGSDLTVHGALSNHARKPAAGGPYLWEDRKLRPIYRLYEDGYGTFMETFKPAQDTGTFSMLRIAGHLPQTFSVAVPSRQLKPAAGKAGEIRGKRILIKDIFEIQGFKISACDRAYYDVAPVATRNAPLIQRLIDKGAIVLGKSKLSSMISREEPAEAVDYHVPFNPRGDGYQSPAGSSSGSAAAVAAYPWLDYAIGTDSTGSGRRPALANGCFALRVSKGALPSEGMMPCFPMFDTPAVFSRTLRGFKDFVQEWCGPDLSTENRLPTSIIYPYDYLPVDVDEQNRELDKFVNDLSKTYQIEIRKFRIDHLWESSPPADAGDQSIYQFLDDVGRRSFYYDFYHSTDDFRAEFQRKHGAFPLVNRVTRRRWEEGAQITQAQRDEAVRRLSVYKRWFLETVLKHETENPLLILPIANVTPVYRDLEPAPPFAQTAWDELWLAPILEAPEITIPIGQRKYFSRISNRSELLPIAISILGLPGTDLSLIEAAEQTLLHRGQRLDVDTGGVMFPERADLADAF